MGNLTFSAIAIGLLLLAGAALLGLTRRRRLQFSAPTNGKVAIVCAGDSLTRGSISGNYIGQLQERFPEYEFFNAGVNGDTSAGLLKRADVLLACNPQIITVLIGTNDVRRSDALAAYISNLDALLGKFKGRRVAVLSIPPLGEDPHSEINHRVAVWNEAINNLTAKHVLTYLPLFETLAVELTTPAKPFKLRIGLMIVASMRRSILHQSFDEIAAANGFSLLTDQIHMSDRAAKIIAILIADWMNT